MRKKRTTKQAKFGSIISSSSFRYGSYYTYEDPPGHFKVVNTDILVDGKYERHTVKHRRLGTAWNEDPVFEDLDISAHDESRGRDKFVVIEAYMQEGSGNSDSRPGCGCTEDCWCVEAIRLSEDGAWDPEGEVIFFRQTKDFPLFIPTVSYHGQMKIPSQEQEKQTY